MFWQGSAASVFDLHSLLTGLGHTFVSSGAADINANGVIVGYAADSSNVVYAVKWTPVIPGDYNSNGIVDAADYTIWRDTLGSMTDLRANGDDTGASTEKIDQADYAIWKTNFGNHGGGAGSSANTNTAVPEPSSVALTTLGFLGLMNFARRRKTVAKTFLLGALIIGASGATSFAISFKTLDDPVADLGSTQATGISGSNIVGVYGTGSTGHGFLYNGSTYTTLDDPLGTGGTSATGISGSNIVGYYQDPNTAHGFLYDGSNYTTIDYSPAVDTIPAGIDGNHIVGVWGDSSPGLRSFLATVPTGPPAHQRLGHQRHWLDRRQWAVRSRWGGRAGGLRSHVSPTIAATSR